MRGHMRIVLQEFLKDEFLKTLEGISLSDLFERDEIAAYVGLHYKPEDVFSHFQLTEWANNNLKTS